MKKLEKKQTGGANKGWWQSIKDAVSGNNNIPRPRPSNFEIIYEHPTEVDNYGTPLQKNLYNKYKGYEHTWQGLDEKGNFKDINGSNPAPCRGLGCYEMVADYERSLNPNLNIGKLLKAGAMPEISAQFKGYADDSKTPVEVDKFIKEHPDAAEGITRELVNQGAARYIKKRGDKNIDALKKHIKSNPDKRFAFQMTRQNGTGHAGYITGVDKYQGKEVFVVTDSRGIQVGQTKTYYDPSMAGEYKNLEDMTIVEMTDGMVAQSGKSQSSKHIPSHAQGANTYVVQQGDSLSKIAKKNNTTVAALQKQNNIKDINKISVNQKLKIAQMGGPSEVPLVAEAGEVMQMQDGSIQQVMPNAPTHDEDVRVSPYGIKKVRKGEGGVIINGAASVLSDSHSKVKNGKRENNDKEEIVKVTVDEAYSIAGMLGLDIKLEKNISPSQLYLKLQSAKDKLSLRIMKSSELANDTHEGKNSLNANMTQLASLPTDEEIYQAVFESQEQKKTASDEEFNEEISAQYGGTPYTERGLYDYPNQPVVVDTGNTGRITMQGINYPVDAYNAKTGEYLTEMQPEEEYNFDAEDVLEIPKAQYGGKVILKQGNTSDTFVGNDKKVYARKNGKYYNVGYVDGSGKTISHEYRPVNQDNLTVDENANRPSLFTKKPNGLVNEYKPPVSAAAPAPGFRTMDNRPIQGKTNSNGETTDSQGNVYDNTGNMIYKNTIPNKDKNGIVPPTAAFKKKPTAPASGYSYRDDLGRFDRASVVPQGFTTSTQANSTWQGGEPTYNQYLDDWSKMIPNLKTLSPREQQKAIYNYALQNNPQIVDNMWKTYGNTKAAGTMNSANPESVNRFADGTYGARTQALDPSLFTSSPMDVPATPASVKDTSVSTEFSPLPPEEVYKPSGDLPNTMLDAADDILGVLNNKDYVSPAYARMKARNNQLLAPYFRDVDLEKPRLFQEDVRPYLDEITSQVNTVTNNINPNSTTGQALAAQIAANASEQSNRIQGQVYNRNMQRLVDWENQSTAIGNQQAQIDDGNRAQYADDWARTLAAKDTVDNQIDMGAAMHKQTMQRDANTLKFSGIINNNFPIDTENGKITFKRKAAPKLVTPSVKNAQYGIKKKKC